MDQSIYDYLYNRTLKEVEKMNIPVHEDFFDIGLRVPLKFSSGYITLPEYEYKNDIIKLTLKKHEYYDAPNHKTGDYCYDIHIFYVGSNIPIMWEHIKRENYYSLTEKITKMLLDISLKILINERR